MDKEIVKEFLRLARAVTETGLALIRVWVEEVRHPHPTFPQGERVDVGGFELWAEMNQVFLEDEARYVPG
jgi:hypothetical protein